MAVARFVVPPLYRVDVFPPPFDLRFDRFPSFGLFLLSAGKELGGHCFGHGVGGGWRFPPLRLLCVSSPPGWSFDH